MNPSDVGKLKFRDRVSVNGREGTVVSVHEPEWMDHRSQGYRKVLQGADIEFDDRLGLSVYIHAEGISMLSAEVEPDAPAKDAGGETPRTADVIRYCTLLDDKEAKNYLIDHAITLEREAAMLRREWNRIKGEMDRDEHVIQARKGHNEAALRASASEREAAALRAEVAAAKAATQRSVAEFWVERFNLRTTLESIRDDEALDLNFCRQLASSVLSEPMEAPIAALADGKGEKPCAGA